MELPPEVLTTSMRAHQKYLALRDRDGSAGATASSSSPTSRRRTAVRRSSPATSACCGPDSGTRASSGSRTTSGRSRAACRHSTGWSSTPSSARWAAGRAPRGAGGRAGPYRTRVPIARWPSVRPCWPRPTSSPAWWASFPSCRASWAATMPALQGEPEAVAAPCRALRAKGAGRSLPDGSPTSVVVALADKLDTLVGFFAVGIKPDRLEGPVCATTCRPRRHSANPREQVRLPLAPPSWRLRGYGERMPAWPSDHPELLAFFADRLKAHLRGEGVRHDLVAAVFALGGRTISCG